MHINSSVLKNTSFAVLPNVHIEIIPWICMYPSRSLSKFWHFAILPSDFLMIRNYRYSDSTLLSFRGNDYPEMFMSFSSIFSSFYYVSSTIYSIVSGLTLNKWYKNHAATCSSRLHIFEIYPCWKNDSSSFILIVIWYSNLIQFSQ